MSTAMVEDVASTTESDDDLIHLWCCDENWSCCGIDLTGHLVYEHPPEDRVCIVCTDPDLPCPLCGEVS